MYYGLSLSLGRCMLGSRTDADAAAYIAAVEAAGATVSGAQASAINDFYVSAKADNYYTSLKRLYLPIWGVAAANAIDMITGASGTFNGGVTHGAGYVQGNGTTGVFSDNANISTHLTSTNLFFGDLKKAIYTSTFKATCGCGNTISDLIIQSLASASTSIGGTGVGDAGFGSGTVTTTAGISYVAFNGTTRRMRHRYSGGVESVFSNGIASEQPAPAIPFSYMARQTGVGSYDFFTTTQIGAAFIGVDSGDTLNDAFSLALKTLWETCTGLTLP